MEVGIFALIQDEQKNILMVKDATRQQLWTLPGGGAEFRELVTDTLKREVKEETSIDIEIGKIRGIFSQQKTPGVVILFQANKISGTPVPDGVETSECKFLSLNAIIRMREQIKPAQLSMIYQVLQSETGTIFNDFSLMPPQ